MKYYSIPLGIVIIFLISCTNPSNKIGLELKIRPLKDTVGFAQYSWQMDSLVSRMHHDGWKNSDAQPWKMVICPHDDYTYVGNLYPELLQNVKAPLLFLMGVAHKASRLGIRDSLVFETYTNWKGPWGNVRVSPVREEIFSLLDNKFAITDDTLHKIEHSVEAMIPFLQYFNRDVSIVPILVPSMSPDRMQECGKALADAIRKVAEDRKWVLGIDYAIVATTDAVHYGNEDWGGSDMAYFGCDEVGNRLAREHEALIIDSCLKGEILPDKIRLFNKYTLKNDNFLEYKWSWCGRYSIPLALYTSYYLTNENPLTGILTGYSTSITSLHIPVDDIRMGTTAIATNCHWVGYAALGYR